MIEPSKNAVISEIYNQANIITASPIVFSSVTSAERFVVTVLPISKIPYSVYRERLKWDKHNWRWEHGSFTEPAYRSTFIGAMKNFNFRFEET